MNTVELFKEANNGVVLKTTQKLRSDDILLTVNVAASMGVIWGKRQPTFRAKKDFQILVVVVHTLDKTGRRRK